MTQKQRSPHKAGNGHKLAGWVRCHCIAAWAWAPLLIPFAVFLILWGYAL